MKFLSIYETDVKKRSEVHLPFSIIDLSLNILINLIYSENSITEFLSNMRDMMSKRVITLRVDAVQYFYIAIENNKVLSHIRDIFAIL